jgi:hypothetical protein
MEYRGSKSDFNAELKPNLKLKSVKEQRVDGSWLLNKLAVPNRSLRCTLMGFERNYQVKILSKQINKYRSYTSIVTPQLQIKLPRDPYLLDANFVSGFTDGEGSFVISIQREPRNKTGWTVKSRFSMSLHYKDIVLLESIRNYFNGVGSINKERKDIIQYRVASLQDLTNVIIPHFDKHPLITQKKADFELFKSIVDLIICKEHLTIEGLHTILSIKASLNRGLSNELKSAFPNIVAIQRPSVPDQKILDPYWLAGFVSGEGCFMVTLINTSSNKLDFRVQLSFQLTQHSRDIELIKSFKNYLDCGIYTEYSTHNFVKFVVTRFSDITEKIIPFFDKYKIVGVKSQDYQDFKKVACLMKNKAHLTSEGLDKIRKIQAGMNKGRQ